MAPLSATLLLFAAPLLTLVPHAGASQLTALRKLPPDAGQKLFAHHLDFASHDSEFVGAVVPRGNGTAEVLWPAYGRHLQADDRGGTHALRRATLLGETSSCPANMNSCADRGSPNKCCQEGSYFTEVPDADVGHVACCPRGSQCGGQVASCPADAVSCPQSLGGGCCIPGYVCRGFGCVPSPSRTTLAPQTPIQTPLPLGTVSSTTSAAVADTSSPPPTTEAASTTDSPSQQPTSSGSSTTSSSGGGDASGTQTGCPTGFYGCLATHGGGCCRTDRDCNTLSCPPPPPATTIAANGATVVVPAESSPRDADATPTCAGGWFLCGESAGPAAGCCPSDFRCGSASCFAAQASQTGSVQKEAPRQSAGGCVGGHGAAAATRKLLLGVVAGACSWALAS